MNAADPMAIPVFAGSIKDAYARAIEAVEPVLVTVGVHIDDRGWSFMNLFQGVMSPRGQVNYSVQYPGVIKAWHRHRDQTDFWLCLSGHIKIGVHRDDDTSWMAVVGEKSPGVVVVPPPLWHGAATVGHAPAGLLYYVTRAYDPANPDEQRRAFDSVPGFPWHAQHR